jgi:hypothetical protein
MFNGLATSAVLRSSVVQINFLEYSGVYSWNHVKGVLPVVKFSHASESTLTCDLVVQSNKRRLRAALLNENPNFSRCPVK